MDGHNDALPKARFEVSWVLTELITTENYEKGARFNISVRR
jgi:hypothetical protein